MPSGSPEQGAWSSQRAARSVRGSHSFRKQASTTTGADQGWPQRSTVIHSARVTGSSSQVTHRLPGRHSSVTASPLRCRRALVPSRWSFARRHMLDTGELTWTPMLRVGTRGIRPPAGAVENMRRLGLIRPRDLVPSPSRRRPARCVVARSLDSVWSLAIAGVQGTRACSRLSLPVPGPRGGRGHTCRTPPLACSVSNATSLSVKCQAGT